MTEEGKQHLVNIMMANAEEIYQNTERPYPVCLACEKEAPAGAGSCPICGGELRLPSDHAVRQELRHASEVARLKSQYGYLNDALRNTERLKQRETTRVAYLESLLGDIAMTEGCTDCIRSICDEGLKARQGGTYNAREGLPQLRSSRRRRS